MRACLEYVVKMVYLTVFSHDQQVVPGGWAGAAMQLSGGSEWVSVCDVAGRVCIIQKSVYQPILRHPIFHVTGTIWNPAGHVSACFYFLVIRDSL